MATKTKARSGATRSKSVGQDPELIDPALRKDYSDLAKWLIGAFGLTRLRMMRSEYEAGFPSDTPAHVRNARIEAINEVFPPFNDKM